MNFDKIRDKIEKVDLLSHPVKFISRVKAHVWGKYNVIHFLLLIGIKKSQAETCL
jgi:hypothetical protein